MLFRDLNPAEVAEFKQWAIDFYHPGAVIERDIWHPVLVAECDRINAADNPTD